MVPVGYLALSAGRAVKIHCADRPDVQKSVLFRTVLNHIGYRAHRGHIEAGGRARVRVSADVKKMRKRAWGPLWGTQGRAWGRWETHAEKKNRGSGSVRVKKQDPAGATCW